MKAERGGERSSRILPGTGKTRKVNIQYGQQTRWSKNKGEQGSIKDDMGVQQRKNWATGAAGGCECLFGETGLTRAYKMNLDLDEDRKEGYSRWREGPRAEGKR